MEPLSRRSGASVPRRRIAYDGGGTRRGAIPHDPAYREANPNRQITELLDGFGDGFLAFDADWRVTYCNRAAERHYGVRREEAIGKVCWDLFPIDPASEVRAFMERAMAAQVELEAETPSEVRPGAWLSMRAFPLQSGLGMTFRDITRSRAAEVREQAAVARLAESEARFRSMADNAPAPIWVTDPRGQLEFANAAFCELAGVPMEALTGDAWARTMHPEDRVRVAAIRNAARDARRPNSWEARFQVDGAWRWLRTASRARFDESGEFQGYVGLALDITDVRHAEDQQRLLINELNHRVKNTLATIQSLARQTLRDGMPIADARERLTERLLALSAAHNVLTRRNWEGADLHEIALEATRPFEHAPGERIRLAGPPARIAANAALAMSMALHELATNAQKHGALSAQGGQVQVSWSLSAAGDAVELEWSETGGPPVTPPVTTGFGSRLLTGLAGELGAAAAIDYAPAGLTCRLRAPLSA